MIPKDRGHPEIHRLCNSESRRLAAPSARITELFLGHLVLAPAPRVSPSARGARIPITPRFCNPSTVSESKSVVLISANPESSPSSFVLPRKSPGIRSCSEVEKLLYAAKQHHIVCHKSPSRMQQMRRDPARRSAVLPQMR